MSTQRDNPLRLEKKRKLDELRKAGIDPYPYNFHRSHEMSYLKEKYQDLQTGEKKPEATVSIAGRLMTKRPMGKAAFFNLQDEKGNMQVYLKLEELPEAARTAFDWIDIGDIVGIKGYMFKTQKGEVSVHAQDFQILCKTLEPLPEKYHGLSDVETKYRYRHLDLITDPESREVFRKRSLILREIRKFLDDRGFLEVETPMLQKVYGGAAAQPFVTHHRALDMQLFLKISPETYLKRLIVGGFDKVYDMNRNFRNEGIDRTHNPEFTMIEWYEAYTDYNDQMERVEELVTGLVEKLHGKLQIEYKGKIVDFARPWKRLSMYDAIQEYGGINVTDLNDDQLFDTIKKLGSDKKRTALRGEMIAELFELTSEKHFWNPIFIMDYPTEISPLTKKHRTKKDLVERFEMYIAGMECANSYSELNDPEDQFARLEQQEAHRKVNDEAQPMDEDFVHAIDVGMPPTGGVGLGVERLVMVLTGRESIRDIILFPTLRPQVD